MFLLRNKEKYLLLIWSSDYVYIREINKCSYYLWTPSPHKVQIQGGQPTTS